METLVCCKFPFAGGQYMKTVTMHADIMMTARDMALETPDTALGHPRMDVLLFEQIPAIVGVWAKTHDRPLVCW